MAYFRVYVLFEVRSLRIAEMFWEIQWQENPDIVATFLSFQTCKYSIRYLKMDVDVVRKVWGFLKVFGGEIVNFNLLLGVRRESGCLDRFCILVWAILRSQNWEY